ncbi:carboxylate-amine ligase [Palleronia caenipelagi]|uniref:Putative glutamate--cysteine ligase 2 n=1 Tax=Palleronia caenipelagi TaxID=2489174 RepID=A0A547PXY3_9RHOB|nr:carboxylate-amine ligase [Palleronia caenipelagi]TRD18966.1 carboxylate-amine ligase [Palleronia caenipelagi]
MADDMFSIGIEEEYLLVNAETLELADTPDEMIDDCRGIIGDQVSPEFLRCQIEIGTKVCANVTEARAELLHLRRTISDTAAKHGLRPIAAACHPFAEWAKQHRSPKDRYDQLHRDLGGVSDRMLICGMHVHVGIPGEDDRIDLMAQLSYFLPHLLALSTSSPFWQGRETGLASYRLGVFDNLPRTGLPARFGSWSEYRRMVDLLVKTGSLKDGTFIWWDLRPSDRFPTLETRICDACTQVDHTVALAAAIQATLRMLWRLKQSNQRWRIYDNVMIQENRWRARRYGINEGLVDFGRGEIVPMAELVREWTGLIAEDAEALGSTEALGVLHDIIANGTSADRQRRIREEALAGGASSEDAMRAVAADLADQFLPDDA